MNSSSYCRSPTMSCSRQPDPSNRNNSKMAKMIYTKLRGAIAACLLLLSVTSSAQQLPAFRPPAVPLIAHDPYFSVWSNSDDLAGDRTRHWTGAPQGMAGIMRVDGKPYRFMGQWYGQMPPQIKQISVEVFPTRTIYEFEASGVHLTLTFISPLLPEDPDVLARPVTYINADVHSVDGQAH